MSALLGVDVRHLVVSVARRAILAHPRPELRLERQASGGWHGNSLPGAAQALVQIPDDGPQSLAPAYRDHLLGDRATAEERRVGAEEDRACARTQRKLRQSQPADRQG